MGQLHLNKVTKSFGEIDVINGVTLDVKDGEFVVFVGPSGCGKSTLLRIIAGLEDATEGGIVIDGVKVNDLAPVKRGIAMVFQSYALYPHMSVFENIAFPLRVEKMPEADLKKKVESVAAVLKLDQRLQQRPGSLSGGQRQRVAIGRAIVREPKIFLFDEPLSNLDAALRADMRIELTKLHHDLAATMIYVTHDQIEAMTMADRIVVLNGGYISQVGKPLELYHKPQNKFVASFIGNPKMNFLPATCIAAKPEGVTVVCEGQTVTIPVEPRDGLTGEKLTLGIRPEHITLGAGDVKFDIVPSVVERLGVNTIVYASASGDAPFSAAFAGAAAVTVDTPATISFNAADCHLFDDKGEALERRTDLHEIDLEALNAV
ncbi:sn-glycerol-3-phosphate ABC transporter ATP-binding protein UgpC [Labrenzia sp. OB1]|uniref:ABC transporter ATP-binding protein n=1 Tax=Labrenzia sp. OB1 TaxID=1561204 RepID=UPI0007B2BEBA|nr:sn-glycerol-3-phosphate ABC transporter ATP-binding protein UgpC [Labrenzia sp. OB1]KZM50104.1 ABC transporter ATP-binding protein [Labrenzia sp. OB1]